MESKQKLSSRRRTRNARPSSSASLGAGAEFDTLSKAQRSERLKYTRLDANLRLADMEPTATPISSCRVCYSPSLTKVLSLGNQYVSDFVTANGETPRAPLELVRCSGCGLVQLKHTFPRKDLYRHYWYRSGISSTMRDALADIATKACEIAKPSRGDVVLDIGCNDGTLLRSYVVPGLIRVGFEPARNLVEEARKGNDWIFNDFFSLEPFKQKFGLSKAKIMTSVAMFYDLEDPNGFVSHVKDCLDPEGVWVIQQNYLVTMLEQNGFDNIGHEHLEYYSLRSLNRLLERHELEVFDVETNDVNGGSFRTYVSHKGTHSTGERVRKMERHESQLSLDKPAAYRAFAENIRSVRSQLRNFITSQVKLGKAVYVYGASNRGNTILQYCGLDHKLIKKAADANPDKWGRKTVGTLIPIVSKEEARRDRPDYFLVLPHHFLKEIKRDEQAYIGSGGKLIIPLPEFRIISANGS